MAKPICVVYYLPDALSIGGNVPDIGKINGMFEGRFPDYHVFAFPSYLSFNGSCDDIRMKVYNAENMDTTSLEEFKKEIMETLMEGQEG